MDKCKACCAGKVLVMVGALNLGLVGVFNYNLLETLLSGMLLRVVYILIGLAGVMMIAACAGKGCKCCKGGTCTPDGGGGGGDAGAPSGM